MITNQNPLYKVGDKVEYRFNAPVNDGLGYKHDVWYPGVIVKHTTDSCTIIKFMADDGREIESHTTYDSFSSGYTTIKLLINPEELEQRRLEWVAKHVAIAKKAYDDRVEFLNSIKFS